MGQKTRTNERRPKNFESSNGIPQVDESARVHGQPPPGPVQNRNGFGQLFLTEQQKSDCGDYGRNGPENGRVHRVV